MENGFIFSMHNRALNVGTSDGNNDNNNATGTFLEDVSSETDPQYEQFLTDVWVGLVLTFMVISCICCMCSCLLYHKFQQWKRHLIQSRNAATVEAGGNFESESLPSYTVVSGLPSYDEAYEQYKKMREKIKSDRSVTDTNPQVVGSQMISKLSVTDLFQLYKQNKQAPS